MFHPLSDKIIICFLRFVFLISSRLLIALSKGFCLWAGKCECIFYSTLKPSRPNVIEIYLDDRKQHLLPSLLHSKEKDLSLISLGFFSLHRSEVNFLLVSFSLWELGKQERYKSDKIKYRFSALVFLFIIDLLIDFYSTLFLKNG